LPITFIADLARGSAESAQADKARHGAAFIRGLNHYMASSHADMPLGCCRLIGYG
jgi:hypothetical protein